MKLARRHPCGKVDTFQIPAGRHFSTSSRRVCSLLRGAVPKMVDWFSSAAATSSCRDSSKKLAASKQIKVGER